MYIYESHMGGFYATTEELDYEWLYCETCGDSDRYIGVANSRKEARRLLKGFYTEAYGLKQIKEFIKSVHWEVEDE